MKWDRKSNFHNRTRKTVWQTFFFFFSPVRSFELSEQSWPSHSQGIRLKGVGVTGVAGIRALEGCEPSPFQNTYKWTWPILRPCMLKHTKQKRRHFEAGMHKHCSVSEDQTVNTLCKQRLCVYAAERACVSERKIRLIKNQEKSQTVGWIS